MFVASKVLGFLLQPSNLAAIALMVGLWLTRNASYLRSGKRLAWAGVAYILLAGILPFGNALVLPLEQRFSGAPEPRPDDGYKGIIILGGFENGWVSAGRGRLTVNEAAERITEGARLARQLPKTKVVFTGGSGTFLRPGAEATGPVAAFLEAVGIARDRIVLEGASRNTYENALFTTRLLKPAPRDRWLLVTSAYHIPRAMGVFRKAGFNVIAYPVDYRTRGPEDIWRIFERYWAGLQRMDLAAGEWLGLTYYYLLGRIDTPLPGP